MPLVKEDLITSGTTVYPFDSYVRVAKVLQVNLFSRDMLVQYIDGEMDSGEFIDEPVTATCIVGSDDPDTTYAPSCVVYGRGDLVNILVLASGRKYAVSLCDLYNNVNRENFATVGGWALYDVLSGVLVDGLDDTDTPENSYLTFWKYHGTPQYNWVEVTKITGDPTKRHIMRRMLDYFLSEMTHSLPITTTEDPVWTWDRSKSGPDNNPMRHIHGRLHKGYRVCGFPYVDDVDFTNDDATLENNIVAYHSTLEDLKTGDCHPLQNGDTIRRYWEHSTVLWFDEEEPTHVVLIGSYPAWDTAQYISFIEVPVYSMTGRKFLEREIIDEDLPTEEIGDILQSWQRYNDQIRVLHTIDRSTYVGWLEHESNLDFSERLHKGVVAYLPTQTGEERDFGILDGHGWAQSGTVFGVNKVKQIQGTITRSLKNFDEATEANGSRYDYEISHNDPTLTGSADLAYGIRFEYEWNSGAEWERQTPVNANKEFNCYTDGVNYMEREVDFDYYCDGHYSLETVYGRILWSDSGSGGVGNAQNFDNEYWHKIYRNGGFVWQDHWHFTKTANSWMGDSTQYVLLYADVEYDLFVHLKIVTDIPSHLGVGPGWPFTEALGTHTQTHYGIVIFEGVEYVLWKYVIDLTHFPAIYNFFPWTQDTGIPIWPDDGGDPANPLGPYSIDSNHNSYFCYDPVFDYWLGTLKPGYSTVGFGFPAPYFGPEGIGMWGIIKTDDYSQPDDLLQVSIDYENDSFCVRFKSFYVNDTNKVLTYPSGDTLYSFEGELPHFVDPTVTNIIEL